MDGFDSVVLSLYRAAHEVPLAEFQDAALRLVKSRVRFDGCKWGASAIDEQGVLFQSVHFHEDDPESASVYNEVRHQDRAAFWAIHHRGRTGNFHFASFYDRLSAIGEYTRRYRHSNALITGLPSADDRLARAQVQLPMPFVQKPIQARVAMRLKFGKAHRAILARCVDFLARERKSQSTPIQRAPLQRACARALH
jgi:hypothetical protein